MKIKTHNLKQVLVSFLRSEFLSNHIVRWLLVINLLLNLNNWVLLVMFINPSDVPIILHYNVYFGVDFIGDWWQAYAISLSGSAFVVINFFLGWYFFSQKERIATYVLFLAATILQIGMLIGNTAIILVNY